MKRICPWLVQVDKETNRHEPCGKKITKYRMEDDGGEKGAAKVRTYSTYCKEHEEESKQSPSHEPCEDLDCAFCE